MFLFVCLFIFRSFLQTLEMIKLNQEEINATKAHIKKTHKVSPGEASWQNRVKFPLLLNLIL